MNSSESRSLIPHGPCRRAGAILLVAAGPALAQQQRWARQFGTSEPDFASALAPDGEGGVFVAGRTDASLFGPYAGGNPYPGDAFLARFDNAGTRRWARQFGTSTSDLVYAAGADGNRGVFLAGASNGAMFGPNAGGADAVLARWDGAGSLVWGRQFGLPSDQVGNAVCSDGTGGAFTAGYVFGGLFGPHRGEVDVFVTLHDGAGALRWGQQVGGYGGGPYNYYDWAKAMAPDGLGGVFVAGATTGMLFGPLWGDSDFFVARYDASGARLWGFQHGGFSWQGEEATALAPDGAGGVYVAGFSTASLFGMSAGALDGFLARYDSAGHLLWGRQFGTGSEDSALALAPDGRGGAFIAGYTEGPLVQTNAGGRDVFVLRYSAEGAQVWGVQFGTPAHDEARSLAPGMSGGVFVGGMTKGALAGPHSGNDDAWVAYFAGACYPDCDTTTGPGNLDVFDFLCFQNRYAVGSPYACDCDTSTGPGDCNVFDFLCFQNAYAAGCP